MRVSWFARTVGIVKWTGELRPVRFLDSPISRREGTRDKDADALEGISGAGALCACYPVGLR